MKSLRPEQVPNAIFKALASPCIMGEIGFVDLAQFPGFKIRLDTPTRVSIHYPNCHPQAFLFQIDIVHGYLCIHEIPCKPKLEGLAWDTALDYIRKTIREIVDRSL
jgi:hypothetical protein